ncbi:O-antigen ligase family protein [Paenibacillus assamensis]|uniref:O-antigen ligase family protein n=1 Tax=Paenibacillus assamensis TaxID=311244 RepID=UPI0003FCE3B6|nr:O-antigen ligase family protein [Paenibacillus assamensis]
MYTYGYTSTNKSNSLNSENRPHYLLLAFVGLFLMWSTFHVALFNGHTVNFESPIYTATLFAAVIALVSMGVFFKHFKLDQKSTLLLWYAPLLPISYAISLWNAASSSYAVNMLLITFIFITFYITTIIITQNGNARSKLTTLLISNAYVIVWFGFINWFGNSNLVKPLISWMGIYFEESGRYKDAVMFTNDGLRLTSVFQYANTYAAYLMAFLFVALFLLGRSTKWWGKLTHASMLVPILLSIMLTLSRGGLVMLPVVFFILLLFLKPYRQLTWIIHLTISGIATLLVLNPITSIGTELYENFTIGTSLKGWGILLVISLLSGVLSLCTEKWITPWLQEKFSSLSSKKIANFIIPLGSAIAGLILFVIFVGTSAKNILPEDIRNRLESINFTQNSVLERGTFYTDALKVISDYPIIGAGGGGWAALYEQYQNNPYVSRQAHNFFLQYIIETGILGFAFLSIFLVYILYHYIRSYIRADDEKRDEHFIYFIIALSILVHSILDFNMSYVYIGILVFIGLGGMTTAIEKDPIANQKRKPKSIKLAYTAIFSLASVVVLITSFTFISAAKAYDKTIEILGTTNNYNEIIEPLDKALSIRPTHPNYVMLKSDLQAQIYVQTQDEEYFTESEKAIKDALKVEPYNKSLWMSLNSLYSHKNMHVDIYKVYDENKYRYPWDIEWYEQYMHIASLLAINPSVDKAATDKYIASTLESLEHIHKGIEHLKTLPEGQLQGRKFEITPKVALHAGQAYYMSGKTQEAHDLMKAHIQENLTNPENPNDKTNQELMRWYLASVQKLGLKDDASLAKLLAFDQTENEKITSIANMKLK